MPTERKIPASDAAGPGQQLSLDLGRGAYVHPNFQRYPDNADILTNGKGKVSLSGMSGHSRRGDIR